jgi:DNA-damage-inducible protein D
MTNLTQSSPFDSTRHEDEYGEYWLARELMPLLEYSKWQRFLDAIDRAKISCKSSKANPSNHFEFLPGSVKTTGGGRPGDDYRLTRYACHLIAMNGDVRKDAIALAQSYFSAKAYEAEVVVPAQGAELERLKIERDIAQANATITVSQLKLAEKTELMANLHGIPMTLALLGRGDEVVEVEKPTIEVIDDKHKVKFKGQTFPQIVEYLKKRHGVRVKNGGTIKKLLELAEKDGLIAQVPRVVLQDYIPEENLPQVYKLLTDGSRQMLIGE